MTLSMTAPVKMPVWVKNDTPPGSQRGKFTKLPIIATSALTMPMVLGPASSRPDVCAISRRRSSSPRPFWLASENPAVMMQAARAPAATHCATAASTCGCGNTM